jgi:hypothetical protein
MTNEEDYSHRFSELEEHVHNAVVWASMLDKIVEDLDRFPSMSKREANLACSKLNHVTDALKEAIDKLDATYQDTIDEAA